MCVTMRSVFLIPILIATGILSSGCASGAGTGSDIGLHVSRAASPSCLLEDQGRAIDRIELPVEMIASVGRNISDWVDRPTVVLVNRFTDPKCRR